MCYEYDHELSIPNLSAFIQVTNQFTAVNITDPRYLIISSLSLRHFSSALGLILTLDQCIIAA